MLKAVGVLSTATMVKGIIVDPRSIDLASVRNGEVPILDSHDILNPLPRLSGKRLGGRERFTRSVADGDVDRAGRRAYEMIEREELTGCSCRFDIKSITVHDADGTMLDTETAPERQDDPGLFFIAQRTTLQEISLTAMPSDPPAMVRACSVDAVCWAAIHDGEERLQRILRPDRHSDDDLYRRDALADRERVHYGAPEPLQTRQYPDDDDGLRRVLCRRPGWFSTRRRSSLRHDSKFPIR